MVRRPPISTRTYTLLPSTTLFRSAHPAGPALSAILRGEDGDRQRPRVHEPRADALAAGGAHAAALSRRPRLYRRTRRVGRDRAGAARFRAASDRRELPRDAAAHARPRRRSEEHTSELQSLMRISYAVFCLKNKNNKKNKQYKQ